MTWSQSEFEQSSLKVVFVETGTCLQSDSEVNVWLNCGEQISAVIKGPLSEEAVINWQITVQSSLNQKWKFGEKQVGVTWISCARRARSSCILRLTAVSSTSLRRTGRRSRTLLVTSHCFRPAMKILPLNMMEKSQNTLLLLSLLFLPGNGQNGTEKLANNKSGFLYLVKQAVGLDLAKGEAGSSVSTFTIKSQHRKRGCSQCLTLVGKKHKATGSERILRQILQPWDQIQTLWLKSSSRMSEAELWVWSDPSSLKADHRLTLTDPRWNGWTGFHVNCCPSSCRVHHRLQQQQMVKQAGLSV